MGRPSRFSPEVRERAVRMVEEHREAHASEWAALQSVAPKLGYTAETLREWVRQAQRNAGHRPGLMTSERERWTALEREVREIFYNPDRSKDLDRTLAPRVQHGAAPQCAGLSTTGSGSHQPRTVEQHDDDPSSLIRTGFTLGARVTNSLTTIATCSGSSRSAPCCRSPRRRIIAIGTNGQVRRAGSRGRSATIQFRVEIQRVYDEHQQVYGPRKVWKQLRRDCIRVERLMRAMGLAGATRALQGVIRVD